MAKWSLKMSNGVDIPLIGIGTSLTNSDEKDKLKNALLEAIKQGYRHFDTATVYGTEKIIGEVLKEQFLSGNLKREDVFLTTKLPAYANRPEMAEKLLKQSLKNLQVDYIDLYLIHSPMSTKANENLDDHLVDENGILMVDDVDLIETWRFMEQAYNDKKVRAIGLSNFNSQQIQNIYDNAKIKPHCLQIELHIFLQQKELINLCKNLNVRLISYSSFGSPSRSLNKKGVPKVDCLNHPIVRELSKKYQRSAAQILLRYLVQKEIACIPKSVNPDRIQQNMNIFDFEINAEDFQKLDGIDEKVRLFPYSKFKHHPNYPFNP